MLGAEPSKEKLEQSRALLDHSNEMMENHFLKDTKFISSDSISIADLQAICEYTQFWITNHDPLSDSPRLSQWRDDCKALLQPHFDDSHKMIYMARDKGIFKPKL